MTDENTPILEALTPEQQAQMPELRAKLDEARGRLLAHEHAVLTPHQRLNLARGNLIAASEEVRAVLAATASDPNVAASSAALNGLMETHLLIASAIRNLDAITHPPDEPTGA